MAPSSDYSQWSHEQLQDRLKLLDAKIERLEVEMTKMTNASTNPTCSDARNGTKSKKLRSERDLEPSRYSHRLIALKFAYLGKNYNGFEYHRNNKTPLPTVEETLWKALNITRLIFPTDNPSIKQDEPNFDGCDYSKCGRTDKGVSAFGQVIGIKVRSNRPLSRAPNPFEAQRNESGKDDGKLDTYQVDIAAQALGELETTEGQTSSTSPLRLDDETISFHPVHDELPYCQILNRVLPPDIRILAWCPYPPVDFSARFSCGERQYTYFFTQPAFTPTPGHLAPAQTQGNDEPEPEVRRSGYLDIPAMQAAAKKFEGTHDFRNFCRVDPSKQIDNFKRNIFHASIVEQSSTDDLSISNVPTSYVSEPAFREVVSHIPISSHSPIRNPELALQGQIVNSSSSPEPKLYAFHLHGTAFLWHQVRHMVAILFLIGQGLEPTSLIDELLDTSKNPCKPMYEMANGTPLVLSDCIFPREGDGALDPDTGRLKDAMEWIYVGSDGGGDPRLSLRENMNARRANGRHGVGGVVDDLWKVWRGRKIDEVLAGRLLDMVARQDNQSEKRVEERGKEVDVCADDAGVKIAEGVEGPIDKEEMSSGNGAQCGQKSTISQKIFQGGDGARHIGTYKSVLKKPRMEPVEVINKRYLEKKGFSLQDGKGWKKVPLVRKENEGGRT